jgi:hypothetical protein
MLIRKAHNGGSLISYVLDICVAVAAHHTSNPMSTL